LDESENCGHDEESVVYRGIHLLGDGTAAFEDGTRSDEQDGCVYKHTRLSLQIENCWTKIFRDWSGQHDGHNHHLPGDPSVSLFNTIISPGGKLSSSRPAGEDYHNGSQLVKRSEHLKLLWFDLPHDNSCLSTKRQGRAAQAVVPPVSVSLCFAVCGGCITTI